MQDSLMNRVRSFDNVDDYSVAEVNVRVMSSSEQHVADAERRFTVTQMTCAVVGTHVATLAVCVLVAVVLCLRFRSADDLERSDDDELDGNNSNNNNNNRRI